MTEQIIGKVMMTFKGDYDATKQYNFLDTVEYNGSSFICKANGTHDTPSENSANWQLLAKSGRDGKDGKDGAPGTNGKDGAPLPDMTQYVLASSLDKLKATLNSNIDASKVAYEKIYPTLINGTTGSVNAFLITLSEKVKMLAFWANVTLPTIQSWSQVDIMSFPQMHEQNHITLNQSVIPDNYHSLWADFSSTSFSLRNQTGATVSNYSFNFFGSGIFLY